KLISDNYELIKNEFDQLNNKTEIAQYHEIDSDRKRISAKTTQKWKTFILNACQRHSIEGENYCSGTVKLLEGIPNLFQAMFSVLEAGKSIPKHHGPYKGYLRYHLTLHAPETNPPSIKIKDKIHVWKSGNEILFDDSWEHEVINKSTEERSILMIDVLRPMPRLPSLINHFIANKLVKNTYGKKIMYNQTKYFQNTIRN
ncbi:MAG: aspartyl/asparaginyl beta-hydroxylase domain-containing protein, partial [Bacteroidota bacterium]